MKRISKKSTWGDIDSFWKNPHPTDLRNKKLMNYIFDLLIDRSYSLEMEPYQGIKRAIFPIYYDQEYIINVMKSLTKSISDIKKKA